MSIKSHLSIENLEGEFWGEPEFNSGLVVKCHKLRKKPIRDFSIEDLRLMIGQGIGLKYLIPLAIKHLENNILAEGNLYEGDLLTNTLAKSTKNYWLNNHSDFDNLKNLILKNKDVLTEKFYLQIQKQILFIND